MISLKKIDLYKKRFNESNFKKKTMPKILSVLFAIIFWFYVMDQVNPEMIRTIPNLQVEILNQESIQSGGYTILDQKVPSVAVKVKGRRKAVMNIKAQDIILSADLKDFHKGINYFSINKKIFADNVTIEDLSENRIQMNIDRLTESTKKITLKMIGKLPEGLSVGDVKLSPEQVIVRGPESYVKLVNGVFGEMNLSTVQNNDNVSIDLQAIDQNGQAVSGIALSSDHVLATLGVLKENSTEIEANLSGNLPVGYKVTAVVLEPKSISLKGQVNNMSLLKVIKTKSIDLTGLMSSQNLNIGLQVPTDLKLQGIPESVNVKITIEKIEEKELIFVASDLKWFNLPTNLSVNLIDPNRNITVKVKAVKSVLDQLKNTDLQLEADAGEMTEGVHKVKITASSNLQTESLTVVPSTIDVEGIKN
jgi:YbbR domain-containing protein